MLPLRDPTTLFPTGVAMVTSIAPQSERLGMTVSSFNSVSHSPPIVLVRIARSEKSYSSCATAEEYAVIVSPPDTRREPFKSETGCLLFEIHNYD